MPVKDLYWVYIKNYDTIIKTNTLQKKANDLNRHFTMKQIY